MANNIVINDILIRQDLNGVIPFTYFGEDNFQKDLGNAGLIKFKFRTSNTSYLDYSSILTPTTPTETTNTVYTPETDDSKYTHTPIFYVDLITEDQSGVSKTSVRGQSDRYATNTPTYTFVIPKFTWDNDLIENPSSFSDDNLANLVGSVWVGTKDNKLYKIQYSDVTISKPYSLTSDSPIEYILFDLNGSAMYLTTYGHLYKYSIDHYMHTGDILTLEVNKDKQLYNDSNKKMVLFEDSELMSVISYLGKIVKQDKDSLLETFSLSGFDAPFKIKKSDYHNCYFIAGTNLLWKYDGTTVTTKYEINDYNIIDFDISKNGEIAIVLNSFSGGIFRVLDRNLYRILYNQTVTGQFRFCKYCNDKFYAIAELSNGTYDYNLAHYLYDLSNGSTYTANVGANSILSSYEESSAIIATDKIEVEYPNGGENLLLGQTIEIKWKSTQSVTDTVKIEIEKADEYYYTVIESTPNTGIYSWKIPTDFDISSDYKIKITWLAPPPNDFDDTSAAYFTIIDFITSSSGPLVPLDSGNIAGIDFDTMTNNMVIVMKDGFVGYFNINTQEFTGLLNLNISDITCMAVRNETIKMFDTVTKVRIFVGSLPYLNDKWDSGEVETDATAMYYGGGNNLVPGETYYINIQAYSENTGWSEIQSRSFKMPVN